MTITFKSRRKNNVSSVYVWISVSRLYHFAHLPNPVELYFKYLAMFLRWTYKNCLHFRFCLGKHSKIFSFITNAMNYKWKCITFFDKIVGIIVPPPPSAPSPLRHHIGQFPVPLIQAFLCDFFVVLLFCLVVAGPMVWMNESPCCTWFFFICSSHIDCWCSMTSYVCFLFAECILFK